MYKHATLRARLTPNIYLSNYVNTTPLDITATHGAEGRAMRSGTTRVAAYRRLEAHLTLTSRVVEWVWVNLECCKKGRKWRGQTMANMSVLFLFLLGYALDPSDGATARFPEIAYR